MMLPRILHRIYANILGYFWRPCPVCGRMFGGHEVGNWPGLHIGSCRSLCVCSKVCSDIAQEKK